MRKNSLLFIIIISKTVFGEEVEFRPKINNGKSAFPGQFAYQAAIEWKFSKNEYYFMCGGALIEPRYVLTAAHCVPETPMRVRLGILKLTDDIRTGETIKVERKMVHEKFNIENATYDIAILRLSKEVNLSDKIKTIKLPKQGSNPSGVALVSGWGRLRQSTTSLPNNLQYLKVTLSSFKECSSAIRTSIGDRSKFRYDKSMICSINNNNGVCNGDSGSPLVQKNKLIGIVSWTTSPCAAKKKPSVYTHIGRYVNWIKQQIINDE